MSLDNKYEYNPYPLGKVPVKFQRPELEQVKQMGYEWNDPRDVIDIFEKKVAKFSGSKFAVSTDSCTHAMELCFRYLLYTGELKKGDIIGLPKRTYISAAMLLLNLEFKIDFEDIFWSGIYYFSGSRVFDGATCWSKDMYQGKGALQCVSFQIKKRIPIGRGGVILCDSQEEYDWFKLATYDGRDLTTKYDDKNHVKMLGFHYYMIPEDAARGIILMDSIKEQGDTGNHSMYPNVEEMIKNI